MAGAWRALVLVAGLAAMACVAQRSLSYEEIVTQALWFFNQGRQGQRLFGLLEAIPPLPSLNSNTMIPLNFRIKETVCFLLWHRRQPRECPFRPGGEERNCTGIFFMLQHILPSLNHPSTVRRVRRSAGSPGVDTPGTESSQLPHAVRDLYEKAKHDIITNMLRNF
ncbi:15 kDa protein B-like [Orcinus orca]|uniref:15 kDa protein B-like n=1 Tax=Orcinus orca TaxID=9733 RepID=UPI0002BD17E0|nr:15 kDa protein B-like [Orcinus orca]